MQSKQAENQSKSNNTFQGGETSSSSVGHDEVGDVEKGKPSLVVLKSTAIDMEQTHAVDVKVAGKSDVKVSLLFVSCCGHKSLNCDYCS
jgi:hypothetical protein